MDIDNKLNKPKWKRIKIPPDGSVIMLDRDFYQAKEEDKQVKVRVIHNFTPNAPEHIKMFDYLLCHGVSYAMITDPQYFIDECLRRRKMEHTLGDLA